MRIRRADVGPLILWSALGAAIAHPAQAAAAPFGSPGWFQQQAQNNQLQAAPSPTAPYAGIGRVTTPEQAQVYTQKSVANLVEVARRIAAAQAAQTAAQQIAVSSTIPDGLAPGGLQVVPSVAADPTLWQNANTPVQTQSAGKTQVTVEQTARNAILTWQTFNVSPNTALHFDQTAGTRTDGRNDWVVLNRVNDPGTAPSQVLGSIKAEGSVYLINPNGVIFGGGSQVNTHSLLVSSLTLFNNDVGKSNDAFLNRGLLGIAADAPALVYPYATRNVDGSYTVSSTSPVSTPGTVPIPPVPLPIQPNPLPVPVPVTSPTPPPISGPVTVQGGAVIHTDPLGYSLLAAPNVSNNGLITADDGQALLVSASASIMLPKPMGTGLESTQLQPRSEGTIYQVTSSPTGSTKTDVTPVGTATNSGLIQAQRGNVTLLGTNVSQNGVVAVSSSLTRSGSVTLTARDEYTLTDTGNGTALTSRSGEVRLGPDSAIALLPSENGEVTTSSAQSTASFKPGSVTLAGNAITFAGNSLLEAPGVAVRATVPLWDHDELGNPRLSATPTGMTAIAGRIYLDSQATIDVSGLADVQLPIGATLVTIPRLGLNELANSPLQRNGALFRLKNVVIDSSISGVRSDGTPWVGSPLLNAQGYVDNIPRHIDELLTDAGSINLSAAQVITAAGSNLNLAGGYLHYMAGVMPGTTHLVDANGRIVDISRADPMQTYMGVAGRFTIPHPRWNVTDTYSNPLLDGSIGAWDPGYIRGGNGGKLSIQGSGIAVMSDPAAILLAGSMSARALSGRRQIGSAQLVAGGALSVGGIDTGALDGLAFVIRDAPVDLNAVVPGFNAQTALKGSAAAAQSPQDPNSVLYWAPLPGPALSDAGLSQLAVTGAQINVNPGQGLSLQPGGAIALSGFRLDIEANLRAPGGKIALSVTPVLGTGSSPTMGLTFRSPSSTAPPATSDIVVGSTATLSTRGRWINDSGLLPDLQSGPAYLDGGSISAVIPFTFATVQTRSATGTSSTKYDVTGSIRLMPGSVLDVSSGGRVTPSGALALRNGVPQGQGGSITLTAGQIPYFLYSLEGSAQAVQPGIGRIELNGQLLGFGFTGGGTLSLRSLDMQIGGDPLFGAGEEALYLKPEFFAVQGFASYKLSAAWDVTIADNTQLRLTHLNLLPDYDTILTAPTGADLYATDAGHPQGLYATVGALDEFHRAPTNLSVAAADYLGSANHQALFAPRSSQVDGHVSLGSNASIVADAGAAISLYSFNQLTLLGSIKAPGGSIVLSGDTNTTNDPFGGLAQYPDASGLLLGYASLSKSVWLGANSTLDVSGVALLDPLARPVTLPDGTRFVPRSGVVLNGGSIVLSNDSGFVIAEQGAKIKASGTSAFLDFLQPLGASQAQGRVSMTRSVSSDAGSVVLGAAGGLYFDGALDAHAGAPGNRGGSLTIVAENNNTILIPARPLGGSFGNLGDRASAEAIVLSQSPQKQPMSDFKVPAGLRPGQVIAGYLTNSYPNGIPCFYCVNLPSLLYFSTDRLQGSGVDNLRLGQDFFYRDPLVSLAFSGDVVLSLKGSFSAFASSYLALPAGTVVIPYTTNSDGFRITDFSAFPKPTSGATGRVGIGAPQVSISASYVSIAGGSLGFSSARTPTDGNTYNNGNITVTATGGMDLSGAVVLQNFGNTSFQSAGDLRLHEPQLPETDSPSPNPGILYTAGNLKLSAARIYPATGSAFVIDANNGGARDSGGNPLPASTISFDAMGPVSTTAPLSAGGLLVVDADTINQNGSLYVPEGRLVLGTTHVSGVSDPAIVDLLEKFVGTAYPPAIPWLINTRSISFGAGSVTAASAGGELIPYGITQDGKTWQYVPVASEIARAAAAGLAALPLKQIAVNASSVSFAPGATVDLSGAGTTSAGGSGNNDLQAIEWVPGTGGTRDVLSRYNVSYASGHSVSVPLFPDARPVYAIIPGLTGLAPYDPAMDDSGKGPLVGQSVYLSGTAGLPPGMYTLLPARYATLPSAYRVVQDPALKDFLPAFNQVLPDGSYRISGHFADTFTGNHDSRETGFIVQSREVWRQYSEYTLSSANGFFADLAASKGTVPVLPLDGGQLALGATTGLSLGGVNLLTGAGIGGNAASVDIAARELQIVSSSTTPVLSGYDGLLVSDLNHLNAGSLLIGGTRTRTASGLTLTAIANSVVVSNDAGTVLSGPEILLLTKTCTAPCADTNAANGLRLDPNATITATGSLPVASAPIAVAGDGALLRVSNGGAAPVTRSALSGKPGLLRLGANSVVSGGQALTLDSSGAVLADPSALFSGQSVDVNAGAIHFANGAGSGAANDLEIGPATLAQLTAARSVSLGSLSSISFDALTANFNGVLTLSAGSLIGNGNVNLSATRLTLSNLRGATAGSPSTAANALSLNAAEIDFGPGALSITGFGSVSATAGQLMAGRGVGSVDFGNAAVNLTAPLLAATSSSSIGLRTAGALSLLPVAGVAAPAFSDIGGKLDLSGASGSISAPISAPAGVISLHATGATGDVQVFGGATLDVGGVARAFFDRTLYAPGGRISLTSDFGNITAASGSRLNFGGATGGGDAGSLSLSAPAGAVTLGSGTLSGQSASGYSGADFRLESGQALDLTSLAPVLSAAGATGSISVHTYAGDLALTSGSLRGTTISLIADGTGAAAGHVVIGSGAVLDVSGAKGGTIELIGSNGVDVEGSLLAKSTLPASATDLGRGGSIFIATSGSGTGINATYGYENVSQSGAIVLGPAAVLDTTGHASQVVDPSTGQLIPNPDYANDVSPNGTVALRAPLLATGGVSVSVSPTAQIVGTRDLSLEGYGVWSTADTNAGNNTHFDGNIDPAGNPGFYGSVTGNGGTATISGTLANFVRAGFTPDASLNRFGFHVRPGIELRNPAGDITVKSTWNLGAAVLDCSPCTADGTTFTGNGVVTQYVYRYNGQAPVLTLRAAGNLAVNASLTDGFVQLANPVAPFITTTGLTLNPAAAGGLQAAQAYDYAHVSGLYQLLNQNFPNVAANVAAPVQQTSGDPAQIAQYYGLYTQLMEYLLYGKLPVGLVKAQWVRVSPAAQLQKTSSSSAGQPPSAEGYALYLLGFGTSTSTGTPQAPPSALVPVFTGAAFSATDNGVSPAVQADSNGWLTGSNPLSLLSASLMGGAGSGCSFTNCTSTSFRLVGGSNLASAAPLALLPRAQADVTLNGHQEYHDPYSQIPDGNFFSNGLLNNTVAFVPTTVRTGTGSIEIAAARDFRLLDTIAPGVVYSAGVPANNLRAGTDSSLLQDTVLKGGGNPDPSKESYNVSNDLVASGVAHPVGAGQLQLRAQRDVVGIQGAYAQGGWRNSQYTRNSQNGQYWWEWMQTGNLLERSLGNPKGTSDSPFGNLVSYDSSGLSVGQITRVTETSINFGAFDQGLLSAGGDTSVSAGRDIVNLGVSLPTTWYLAPKDRCASGWCTVGGASLTVHAGGDIVSGSYFVSRGVARIEADGGIVSRPGTSPTVTRHTLVLFDGGVVYEPTPLPVATILALQDARVALLAHGAVELAGVYDPSLLRVIGGQPGLNEKIEGLYLRSVDSQPYSANSALDVNALAGPVRFGSLTVDMARSLMALTTTFYEAAEILPSRLGLQAFGGDISIESSAGLYPSPSSNLSVIAQGSVHLTNLYVTGISVPQQLNPFGMIDADPAVLPSPLLQFNGATQEIPRALTYFSQYISSKPDALLHAALPLHAQDGESAIVYAVNGDILDGPVGLPKAMDGALLLALDKPARIRAGHDIVNLSFEGQNNRPSDLTSIQAGRDIYDDFSGFTQNVAAFDGFTGLLTTEAADWFFVPRLILSGPGTFLLEAGRNLGPFIGQSRVGTTREKANFIDQHPHYQVGFDANSNQINALVKVQLGTTPVTGIDTVGDSLNPYLPPDGASIVLQVGTRPGMARDSFIDRYIAPNSPNHAAGIRSYVPDLVDFMERYQAGLSFSTGYVKDLPILPVLTADQAWTAFQLLPELTQRLFMNQVFQDVLRTVGLDYNIAANPYFHQYARGYQAINTLFPAALGYTANSLLGGVNGASQTVATGDLDLRDTTAQTQRGGSISLLAPGGRALLGSTSAPPSVLDGAGHLFAGPATQGILTLERGDVNLFLDRSLLLAQSRIFTEQGGDMLIWSSNGDINAGSGARTATEIPAPIYRCDNEHYCYGDSRGRVSGAGIATLQSIPGAPPGNVVLVAPRGTVDAGEGGIRVSGNLVVAAFAVANADNIQVKGTTIGVPTGKVDVAQLSAGSSAAAAAQQQAAALARQQPRDSAATMITVEFIGFGEPDEHKRK